MVLRIRRAKPEQMASKRGGCEDPEGCGGAGAIEDQRGAGEKEEPD